MKQSLFKIEEDYMKILFLLEESEGELTPELEEAIKINDEDFYTKAKNYRSIIVKWRGEIASAKAEIDRITKFKNSRVNAIERLSTALDNALQSRGKKELDFGIDGRVSYRKSTYVHLEEGVKVPKKYENRTVTVKPDKIKIKEALNAGVKVRGASLKEKDNLQIK